MTLAVIVGFFALCGIVHLASNDEPAKPEVIEVKKGQTFTITADGEWSIKDSKTGKLIDK